MRKFVLLRFGGNVKGLRQANNFSVHDMARLCDFSVDKILCIESGDDALSIDTILLLCVVLNVTPNDLFDGLYA